MIYQKLDEKMELLNMKEEMAERYFSEGFSGGENAMKSFTVDVGTNIVFGRNSTLGLDIDAL